MHNQTAIHLKSCRKSMASPYPRVFQLLAIMSVISGFLAMNAPGLAISMGIYIVLKSALSIITVRLLKLLNKQLKKSYPEVSKLLLKVEYELNKFRKLPWLAFFLGGGVWSTLASPAQAQFLNGAQTFFTTSFPAADPAVIALIFNVLRGLLLLYLAIALILVVNAARNDQDWQNAAKLPMIVMLVVVVGDVLTGMIVGTAPTP